MSYASQPFKNTCVPMYCLASWFPHTEFFCTGREWLLHFLHLWSKPLIVRYALKDIQREWNRREMSDQSGFHDLSIEEGKKWLMPCCLWEAWRLGKPSPVKLLVFSAKKKEKTVDSLKINRNLRLWPQTFSIWHKMLSKFEKTSLPANRNCLLF